MLFYWSLSWHKMILVFEFKLFLMWQGLSSTIMTSYWELQSGLRVFTTIWARAFDVSSRFDFCSLLLSGKTDSKFNDSVSPKRRCWNQLLGCVINIMLVLKPTASLPIRHHIKFKFSWTVEPRATSPRCLLSCRWPSNRSWKKRWAWNSSNWVIFGSFRLKKKTSWPKPSNRAIA